MEPFQDLVLRARCCLSPRKQLTGAENRFVITICRGPEVTSHLTLNSSAKVDPNPITTKRSKSISLGLWVDQALHENQTTDKAVFVEHSWPQPISGTTY